MAGLDEKGSDFCGCNSSCKCHGSVSDKTRVSAHILGSADNSIDLWVSTPSKTKWTFVEEVEEEVKIKKYYDKLRKQNNELCKEE